MLFFSPALTRPLDRVMIIKNDAIGDYLLVRNFFYELRKDARFSKSRFYLVCSPKAKAVAQELDGALFEEIITSDFDMGKGGNALHFFKKLKSYRCDYLIHPTFSPDFKALSMMVYSTARHKIGFDSDTINCTPEQKAYFNQFYTQIISLKDNYGHEFLKHKEFFSTLLKRNIDLQKPHIELKGTEKDESIVLCPGAHHSWRIWAPENYARLLTELMTQFPSHTFKIITGPGEDALHDAIAALVKHLLQSVKSAPVHEFIQHLSRARLIICNDSAPAHFAVALGVNSVCISNGNNYKRFVPYPESCHANQLLVLPPALKDPRFEGGHNPYYTGSTVDINTIIFDEVLNACLLQL